MAKFSCRNLVQIGSHKNCLENSQLKNGLIKINFHLEKKREVTQDFKKNRNIGKYIFSFCQVIFFE
jgi:hypothetical protein